MDPLSDRAKIIRVQRHVLDHDYGQDIDTAHIVAGLGEVVAVVIAALPPHLSAYAFAAFLDGVTANYEAECARARAGRTALGPVH